jgi:peptidase E
VGGDTTRKVYKLNKSDLSKVAESIGYGGNIRSITSDDNYLYVGGDTTRKVYKLNKSDLSKVAESIGYGGNIYSIASDDNYLYVGGGTTNKVYKLNKVAYLYKNLKLVVIGSV